MTDKKTENVDKINQGELLLDYWSAKFPSKIKSLDSGLSSDEIYDCTQSSTHQPPIQYRITFIKAVIKQLELRGSDEDTAKWYDCLSNLSACPIQTEQFYRLYDLSKVQTEDCLHQIPIKIYEDEKAFVSDGSTGYITWTACLELSKWLKMISHELKECAWAFELGCGTGFLAISLVKQFPQLKHYRATDIHQGVLERCQNNVVANHLHGLIDMTQLDWIHDEKKFSTYFHEEAIQNYSTPGILLGADIIFDVSVVESLSKIIQSFLMLKPRGRVFLSLTKRNEKTIESFQHEIRKNNMQIRVVHTWECCDGQGMILEVIQDTVS